jgi:glutaryl-CoA dehydrogenase
MTFTPLVGDFYQLESQLSPQEQEFLLTLRTYLETEVKPILADHWERAEFPRSVVAGLAASGVLGMAAHETAAFPTSAVFRGWVCLELGRIDASVATFVGVQNGLAMGSIEICGSPEQRAEWLPGMGREGQLSRRRAVSIRAGHLAKYC